MRRSPLAKLIYSMFASLDGFVEDADGGFGWAAPSEEVHAFANEIGASYWSPKTSSR